MILSDLEELGLLTATNGAELSRLLKTPLTASFSASLRQQLANIFSTYPILATTLCNILSTRCIQVGNMELSRAMWAPFVAQILDDKSDPSASPHSDLGAPSARFHLLQYLTFTAQNEPSNATNVFSTLVSLYFTPALTTSYSNAFGHPIRQKIYSALLALPGGPQAYALQLYTSIEEAAVRRECEKLTSSLAWPFEVLRPIAGNRRQSFPAGSLTSDSDSSLDQNAVSSITDAERSSRLQEFWAQYFDFVTISKNHFIEYIITQFFDLIDQHRFEDCRVLLYPFPQMKPLLLLMCFEKFGNDIKSKQAILDMLWNEEQDELDERPKAVKNQVLNDAVHTISYQVKLARWAGSLLLKQHADEIERGESDVLVIGNERVKVPENEPDFAVSNLVSNMLQHHGILFILHQYLHNIELEDLERIIKQTPISADETTAHTQTALLATDLTLLYCYLVLKEVVGQVQLASQRQIKVDPSAVSRIERVISKLESPCVLLSLLETIFNFLFMRSDAWSTSPSLRTLAHASTRRGATAAPEAATFVVGPELSFALVSVISKSLDETLKPHQAELSELDAERLILFSEKLDEVRWRLNLVKSRPYFLTPLLSLNGNASTERADLSRITESYDSTAASTPVASDCSTPISIVSLLIAKPESLLIRTIRERDFESAHAIINFFKMDQRTTESEELDVDGLSTGASHLAKVSELVYTIRRDLTAGKPISTIIDPIIKNSDAKKDNKSASPPISKLEVFFLLCDMAMTSNLPSDQTSKLLESAQVLCDEIKAKLAPEDADHFVDYMDRLKTLEKAESLAEPLPTLRAGGLEGTSAESLVTGMASNGGASSQNSASMTWIPNGLNARLLALESWPTESDALGGYLQLRSRLLGAVSKLRTIVSQSVTSREKGFASPVGLDSEDTLRKLTLFLSVDDWVSTPTTPGSDPATPAKSLPIPSASTRTPSHINSSAPFRTPSGAPTVAPSPSTRARTAFNSLGDGFLQAFLRQLLMIGVSLRDDARLGRTDFFEHLHAAPKHLLAELVYGSRNYNMAESIAGELELDLVSLILELMGTIKPSRMQRAGPGSSNSDSSYVSSSGSSNSLNSGNATPNNIQHRAARKGLNSSAMTPNSDLALDYMPSSVNYGSSLSYEYGMNTGISNVAGNDGDKYTLHLNLVEYLKSHSPFVATLACILRAPSDKYDERFLSYALSSTKRHFAPLHLWLRVKVRQFGVFYNTTLRDQPEDVSYPTGPAFVQASRNASSNGSQTTDVTGTSLNGSSHMVPALSSSQSSQNNLGHSLTQQGSVPMQKWHANRATALSASSSLVPSAASSFEPGFEHSFGARGGRGMGPRGTIGSVGGDLSASFASSVGSMGSGLGLGGAASPTSSMNELGIDGGLQNNAVLAARAQQRRQVANSQLTLRSESSRFSDDDADEDPASKRDIDEGDGNFANSTATNLASSGINISSPRSPAMRIKPSSSVSGAVSSSIPHSSSLSSRPEFTLKNDVDLGNGSGVGGISMNQEMDQLCLKYPTIDILDASEAHVFEQIFQNESLQAEVSMYAKAVEKLEKAGHLHKALELADSALPAGAPDSLLRRLVDNTSDKNLASEYVLRMSNKTEAAQLALSLVAHWDIPTIMQVLFMCDCHLSKELSIIEAQGAKKDDPSQSKLKTEISTALAKTRDMYERVQRYSEILDVVKDDVQPRWKSWLELDELARKDLAVVVHMLLNGGHYDIARRLTEHFKHTFLKLRVEEKYLLHLLELGDTRGVRMRLRSLEGEEAVRIAQSLMDLVSTNDDRLFLTQFILERKAQQQKLLSEISGSSSTGAANGGSSELTTLTATELGLKILLCLPPELQKVFQPLMSSPFVIIESLLVSEQTLVLNKLFKEIPQVHDDQLVLKYARKALDATRLFSAADAVLMHRTASNSSMRDSYPGASTTPSSTAPHSRAVSDDEDLPPQTIGYFDPHDNASSTTNYGALSRYGLSQASSAVPGSNLPHTPAKKLYLADEKKEHVYASAPNYPLAAGILDLCRNANLVAATCIEISDQLSARLHSIKDRLFVVRIIQQLLYYAKLRLMTSDFSALDLVQTCDMLLQRTELLLQLIFCGGTATASAVAELSKGLSLSMLADPQKARSLRERLIENDLLDLALLVATKCGVETDPVWAAKALRMLETNRYQEAKQLFRYCLVSIYPEEQNDEIAQQQTRSSGGLGASSTKTVSDNSLLLSKILMILETNVPIETEKLAQRRDYLSSLVRPPHNASAVMQKDSMAWHKRFKNMEDIDEGEGAQKALEALRKTTPGSTPTSSPASTPVVIRRHTLDSIRYMQCIYYLQRFGSEEMIIKFWLRHDLLEDCLRHMDSKPPPYDTKLLLLVVNHALSRNIFGRFRDALYKIDKNVERWRESMLAICVHFHKANMPTVLLELQIAMKDFSRAGLTSMTIYNAQTDPLVRIHYLELVQKYLSKALELYDETLAIQQKSTSSTSRLPMTKVDIAKHIKTAGLQAKLIEFSLTLEPTKSNPTPDLLPEDVSLWGPSAAKQQITEFLIVNHNFDLAFKIIQEYRLSSDKIYRDALVKMAKKKQTKKIEELLKSIKIVLSGRELDACHVAVARVYGMVHSDFSTAESFAGKVVDQPLACEAYIACRKLKQAYLIAAKLKDLDLVRAIQAEAKRLDMKREYELCDTFLKSYDLSYNQSSSS